MEDSIEDFKSGRINIKELKESIELNGSALEIMPFSMIKELEDIEYKLIIVQFAEEEECTPNTEEVLKQLETWLTKVPVESGTELSE